MSLLSWMNRSKPQPTLSQTEKADERQALKAELAQQVVTFERRAHTVTRIAEDAIRSMQRGDGK